MRPYIEKPATRCIPCVRRGASNACVRNYAKRYEPAVVLWAQGGNVYEPNPGRIAENVRCRIVDGKELADGDIVLLHETNLWMVEAVAIMGPRLLEAGYRLLTVQELLQLSERGCVYGETYYRKDG